MTDCPPVHGVTFRPIPRLPYCVAGDDGSVWTRRPLHRQKPENVKWRKKVASKGRSGYLVVHFHIGGKTKSFLVHRLILEAFVGPCPAGMEGCHRDDVKANNVPANLRWDTRTANIADRTARGVTNVGERNGMAKLTEEEVASIKREYKKGKCGYIRLGKKYGVNPFTVRGIIRRGRWRHVV